MIRRFEFIGGTSAKFWEVSVRYGRLAQLPPIVYQPDPKQPADLPVASQVNYR